MGIYIDRGYNLQAAKEAIQSEIDAWYSGAALDTFDSDVLGGAIHRYECNETAQLRFMNGKVSNQPVLLSCARVPVDPEAAMDWQMVSHTATECGKVHSAYMRFSASIDAQRSTYLQQVTAATTVSAVEAVFYTLYPPAPR